MGFTMDNARSKYLVLNDQKIADFEHKIEKEAFPFNHTLNSSPLMEMPALRSLCSYISRYHGKFHFEIGDNDVGAGFAAIPKKMTLLDAFDGLNQKTLLLLKSIHIHPDYKKLLDDFLEEFSAARGVEFFRRYRRPICTIILASPERVTPYHIDDFENLLLQVHGSKKFFVFDGTDRDVISARELELYWGGAIMMYPDTLKRYKPKRLSTTLRQVLAFTFHSLSRIGHRTAARYL